MLEQKELSSLGIDISWREPLNKAFIKYEIKDKIEIAMFISQCLHESRKFTCLEESFNYTPERLLEVFEPRIKTFEKAKELVNSGKKEIANFIYNGRMGNRYGTDDGYNYRGRGIIQLTGRDNYDYYGKKTGVDILNYPNLALDYNTACLLASAYWTEKGIGKYAKKGDVKTVTKIINGGFNGLKEREKLFETARKIIC